MARFRQFTKRQLWQRFLVQKVPTFYMIVDKIHYDIHPVVLVTYRTYNVNYYNRARAKLYLSIINMFFAQHNLIILD
jgi:hypothetical protein